MFKGKVIIIYGARQVGKTTLSKEILKKYEGKGKYINCELLASKMALETTNEKLLRSYFGDSKVIVLDEAQRIENIGLILKIIIDAYPELQIIATGSSSFDLAGKLSEPLTGRAYRFMLFPLSLEEIGSKYDRIQLDTMLENILRFGSYPGVVDRHEEEAILNINDIASNYLYKDILGFEKLKRSDLLLKLLQALALQIGGEVSLNELSNLLNANIHTIERYINLLEQCFVIFRLRSFSRNLRKELGKKYKIFFYDLGIRNSLLQNFTNTAIRSDTGGLWENFCISERIKYNQAHLRFVNTYFWRTYDGKEIDLIEEHAGRLDGYEFKWGKQRKAYKPPQEFIDTYEGSSVSKIDRQNYQEFLMG